MTGAASGAGTGAAAGGRDDPPALRDLVRRLLDATGPGGAADIVLAGHPVLRRVAQPYDGDLDAEELGALVDLMRVTMRRAPGVGLAAPQIGLPVAIAVLEDPGLASAELTVERERPGTPFRVLVNPRYEPVDDERVGFYEGCLSFVGYQAVVHRHRRVRLLAQDQHGAEVDEVVAGWTARIVQHETDHLGGTLYVDRAEPRSLAASEGVGLRWMAEPHPRAAAQALGFDLPSAVSPASEASGPPERASARSRAPRAPRAPRSSSRRGSRGA